MLAYPYETGRAPLSRRPLLSSPPDSPPACACHSPCACVCTSLPPPPPPELREFPNRHVHDVGHGDFAIKPADAHSLLRPEAVESFYLLWKASGDPRYRQWAWEVHRALHRWARVRAADRHGGAGDAAAADAGGAADGCQAGGEEGSDGGPGSSCETSGDAASGGDGGGGGFSSLQSVLAVPPPRRDRMESFFMAETLKYLWLIFSEPPDRCLHASCQQGCGGGGGGEPLLPLDRFVFNTEAHPLPVVGPAGAAAATSGVQPCIDADSPLLRPFGDGGAKPDVEPAAKAAQTTVAASGEAEPATGGGGDSSSSSGDGGDAAAADSSDDSSGSESSSSSSGKGGSVSIVDGGGGPSAGEGEPAGAGSGDLATRVAAAAAQAAGIDAALVGMAAAVDQLAGVAGGGADGESLPPPLERGGGSSAAESTAEL